MANYYYPVNAAPFHFDSQFYPGWAPTYSFGQPHPHSYLTTRTQPAVSPKVHPEPQPSCNLFIVGLPRSFDTNKVKALFSQFGPVFSAVIFKSRRTACVQFFDISDAIQAMAELNGMSLTPNRPLSIRFADTTYTPRRPSMPESPKSDSDSVGHSSESDDGAQFPMSDVGSEPGMGLDLDLDAILNGSAAEVVEAGLPGDVSGPPSPAAIAEANRLLEACWAAAKMYGAIEEQVFTLFNPSNLLQQSC